MASVSQVTSPAQLHGRERERQRLDELLAGAGGALTLSAEPGLGKTALLEDTARKAAGQGRAVLRTRGMESAARPFAGLRRLLRPLAGRIGSLPPTRRAALTGLGDGLGDGLGGERLSAAVLDLLAAAAPILCCVDDAEWLDRPSLNTLALAARDLTDEAVTILFAAWDDGDEPLIPGVPVLWLPPLSGDSSGGLLGDLTPWPVTVGVRHRLVRAARGNPLALTELVRELTPEQLAGTAPLPDPWPPCEAVERSYRARLRGLPAGTRRLLLVVAAEEEAGSGAVIGTDRGGGNGAISGGGTGMDTGALLRAADAADLDLSALEPAETAGIVRISDGRVSFPNPFLRSAIYRGATLARRRAAHRLLARVLDDDRRVWHEAVVASGPSRRLAARLEAAARGADRARSAAALERAAELTPDDQAKTRLMIAAARERWLAGRPVRALRILQRVPQVGAHRGEIELLRGEIELRCGVPRDAYQTLFAAATHLADPQRGVLALIRASSASAYAGDHHGLLAAAQRAAGLRRDTEPPAVRLMLEYLAGASAAHLGHHDAAVRPLRNVLALAGQTDDPSALIWASVAGLLLGDDAPARAATVRAVNTARAAGARALVPQAMEFRAYAEFWTGRPAPATAIALEGLRLAYQTGQDNCACHHQAALAMLAAIQGDEATCVARARATQIEAAPHGLGLPSALCTWALAFLDLSLGRHGNAAARLLALARSRAGHGQLSIRMLTTPHYVEAAVRSGATTAARTALTVFERWAASTRSPANLALAARCRGLLADGAEAEAYLRDALELHAVSDRDFERARTELLLGTLLRRRRRPGAARDHLRVALASFEAFGAPIWADHARAELRATGVRSGTSPVIDRLTPQQLQIARFVAQGATNREVAARLFLSPRTVDHHLRNVFTRLGIGSRVQLARLLPEPESAWRQGDDTATTL